MAKQMDRKVPEIRLHNCDGDWEEKPIGKILSEVKRSVLMEDNQQYELITVKRRNEGVVSRGHLHGRDILVKNYSQLRAGDFVISKRQVVHGATGIVRDELDGAIVSNEYLVAVENSEISTEFLTILSSLPDMRKKFFLSSYGVDIEKLFFDAEDWRQRTVTIPNKAEQTQIGTYFKALDRMIELHQRKHNKLVTLKQAMLQKMFPQEGATTPEIRFKEFSGDWKQKKLLDDIAKIIDFRGRTPKKLGLEWSTSGYLALSALNVKNGRIDFSADANYGDEQLYNTWMKGADLHRNQVIFTTEAPMGNVAQIPDNQKYILSQRTIAFEVNENALSEDYLAILLRTSFMFRKLSSLSSGGTAKGVSQKSLSSLTAFFPNDISEQQKIGTYFRNLDELITKHTTQLQKLKQIKSACLEKMFV